jgi:hypothetical protein
VVLDATAAKSSRAALAIISALHAQTIRDARAPPPSDAPRSRASAFLQRRERDVATIYRDLAEQLHIAVTARYAAFRR